MTRGEEDKEKIDTVGGMNKGFMPSLGNRTSMGQTFNNQLSGGGTSMGQAFGRGLTERRLPRTSARKGFNFMGKPENQFRLGGWG